MSVKSKKKDDFDCNKIKVIPQYKEDTCWFNAMLMISLYSNRSRKLMRRISKQWDKKDSFFKIMKIII